MSEEPKTYLEAETEFFAADDKRLEPYSRAMTFEAGWDARDAEVERLTAQLQAARATIAEAHLLMEGVHCGQDDHDDAFGILLRADLSTLAEHDKQVAAKALKDAALEVPALNALRGHVRSYVKHWLRARAASIEQTEAE